MKKHLVVLTCVLAGLLAGCGSAAPAAETSPTPAAAQSVAPAGPTSSPTLTSTPRPTSVRGNLIKQVGEPAWIGTPGSHAVKFTVKSISEGVACQYYQPKNGQIITLDLDVETTAALRELSNKKFFTTLSWKAIAENGTTVNGDPVAYGCLDSASQLPQEMGPSEKATGKIAFDVPAGRGTLIFESIAVTGGWEWSYPAK
ncbi:hypothetical protein J2W20_002943 [Sinomonas atrocyanea]|uniref:hypothetical protein n=1 Tax=Sinomonas atrocyanea TaxID=37927 RepID=UPI00278BA7DF|nr:hypothetical protein [Sinomonas atrocyanea]MDQ0261029.1 hypothetical protein [Sinomonas atrocyanea]